MNASRRPTYRATFEGNEIDLRSLLAELVANPSLTSHAPPPNLPSLARTIPHIISAALTSPYRTAGFYPTATPNCRVLPFSKQTLLVDLLGAVDRGGKPDFDSRRGPVHHLEIDLFRPVPASHQTAIPKFPPQDLAPLTLFRHLAYLKIEGMTQSYQIQIWQCVWLNPGLSTLSLSMSTKSQMLCSRTIRVARFLADSYPSMRQVCNGHQRAYVPPKISLVRLELTRFIVGSEPFEWFDGRKLKEICFTECNDAGFRLVGDDWTATTVLTAPGNGPSERTSTNLMSTRTRRPSKIGHQEEAGWPSAKELAALRDL